MAIERAKVEVFKLDDRSAEEVKAARQQVLSAETEPRFSNG
jgi:hypothetical protein